MLLIESQIIKKILQEIHTPKNVLDIGSANIEYRTVTQSFIDENIFQPLRNKNARISFLDVSQGDGVDIVADISSKSFVLDNQYDLVICTNMLHFVPDLQTSISNISSLVRNGGYLILTTPLQIPFHDGRYDTLSRWNPVELSDFFSPYSFEIKFTAEMSQILSLSKWMKLMVGSFIEIFVWKKFSAIIFSITQCLSNEMKASLIFARKNEQ